MKRTALRVARHTRVRGKISGTTAVPRLSVFRSNRHICAQLIDDSIGRTLACADDLRRKNEKNESLAKLKRSARAFFVGEGLAKRAKALKISRVVFDRGGYRYHGIIKAVADGARKGGLKF
ncbi:MAG: 50S ribosomal protein L18 [Patescibacteria group bacterium]